MLGDPWQTADPVWSLDGRVIRHRQPALNVLVGLVVAESPAALVVPTMSYADAVYLYERMYTRTPPDYVIDDVADYLAGVWLGMPHWQASRFWTETLGSWSQIDGALLYRGVDLMALSPRRATSVLLAVWPRLLGDRWDAWWSKVSAEPMAQVRRRAARESAQEVADEWSAAFAAYGQMGDE